MLVDGIAGPIGDLDDLVAAFDSTTPLTVGIEEEVMLFEPGTTRLAPVASEVVATVGHPSIKEELPASQVELVTTPHREVSGAMSDLARARRRLLGACSDIASPAAAALHPSTTRAVLGSSVRHAEIEAEFGEVARRQLVGSLQVHVATGSAESTLTVYNALRGYLPELAAMAASAPFHDGRDTGLASMRPLVSGQLPRQGVPPAIESWEQLAAELAWGAASGAVPEPRRWWWELRPHILHGTLEVRVPDVQPTVDDADAVVRTVHALVAYLLDRHDGGENLGAPASWRIAENRWRALRDGVHGELLDLTSGTPRSTSRRIRQLLDAIEPHAREGDLEGARRLIRSPGADRLRRVGIGSAVDWLVEQFPPSAATHV